MTTPDTITLDAGWERCPLCEGSGWLSDEDVADMVCGKCDGTGKGRRREVVLVRGSGTLPHYSRREGNTIRDPFLYLTTDQGYWVLVSDLFGRVTIAPDSRTPEQVANIINQSQLLAVLLRVSEAQQEER